MTSYRLIEPEGLEDVAMSDERTHHVLRVEQEGGGVGRAVMWLDDFFLKGVRSYEFRQEVDEPRILRLEMIVDSIEAVVDVTDLSTAKYRQFAKVEPR